MSNFLMEVMEQTAPLKDEQVTLLHSQAHTLHNHLCFLWPGPCEMVRAGCQNRQQGLNYAETTA